MEYRRAFYLNFLPQVRNRLGTIKWPTLSAATIFLLTACWVIYRWFLTSDVFEFGDETMVLVTARQIAAGDRLYDDIFSQWGPGTIAIAWLAKAFGADSFVGFRVPVLLLQIFATASILLSRVWQHRTQGFIAAAVFAFVTSALGPIWLGHMLLYTTVGGYLVTVSIALVLAPLLMDRSPPLSAYAIAGACWTFLIACAISFLPAALLFGLTTLLLVPQKKITSVLPLISSALIGAIVVSALMIVWMALFADFQGYWVNHIRFNTEVFSKIVSPPMNPLSPFKYVMRAFNDPLHSDFFPSFVVILLFLSGTGAFFASGAARKKIVNILAMTLMACMILYLNPRGGTLHHPGGVMLASIGVIAIGFSCLIQMQISRIILITMMIAPFGLVISAYKSGTAIYGAGVETIELRNTGRNSQQVSAPFHNAIRAVVDEDERVVVWEFLPVLYFNTDRLPSSSHMFLLPAQMSWLQLHGPAKGLPDPCTELQQKSPPAIVLVYWQPQNVKDFAPCVPEFAEKNYIAINSTPPILYVRPDRTNRLRSEQIEKLP